MKSEEGPKALLEQLKKKMQDQNRALNALRKKMKTVETNKKVKREN